ncbi:MULTISPECIES: LysR family transcriptional regulator [Caproicibacterium]|uniref:LysR family transcriptional regulator n=1 Tax=Caproicibacterium argilliputei TaxID=3030016 RepID=A0AA97DBG7_9FIRM|nr:LysR family transcriptional regulator [Caproicibacterium argilliputei]WOC32714.1 LysR family transcriptional regulator [Caproicibacterium argilliputei]
MSVSYEYYRIFYYVAKYQSFTKAANILLNGQPNITRCMNNLEHELGCRLFLRTNRGVTLTPEGEKLYAHVAVAYEQIRAGEEELSTDKTLQSGILSIGTSETALYGLLLEKLRSFHMTYPGIRLRISNQSTPQALSALKNGMVDIAVVTTPTGAHKPLHETPLKSFREVLIGGPQFAFLAEKSFHLHELTQYPFICLGKDTMTYAFYNRLFLQHGLPLQPDTETATTDQILLLVKNDLGIGFLPENMAEEALAHGDVFQIFLKDVIPERSICLVEDTDRPLNIAAGRFRSVLLDSGCRPSGSL